MFKLYRMAFRADKRSHPCRSGWLRGFGELNLSLQHSWVFYYLLLSQWNLVVAPNYSVPLPVHTAPPPGTNPSSFTHRFLQWRDTHVFRVIPFTTSGKQQRQRNCWFIFSFIFFGFYKEQINALNRIVSYLFSFSKLNFAETNWSKTLVEASSITWSSEVELPERIL